jgi:hypothetical protein
MRRATITLVAAPCRGSRTSGTGSPADNVYAFSMLYCVAVWVFSFRSAIFPKRCTGH